MAAKHQRQIIREAIKATLLGKTVAGSRVYETRLVPWRTQELPAISVYAGDESSDDRDTAPRELERTVDMTIDAALFADADVDDALDAFALEIERAMHADPTLGGTASDSTLISTTIGTMAEGNRPLGAIQLVYRTTYYTYAPDPADATLDDLNTINIQTRLNCEADPTEDRIEFEE